MRSSVLFASAFLISGFVYLAGCAGALPVVGCSNPGCAKPDEPTQPTAEAQRQDASSASVGSTNVSTA